MSLTCLPLAYVFLTFAVLPQTIAFHGPVLEVSYVVLFLESQQAVAVWFVVGKVAVVGRTIRIESVAFAHLVMQTELSFVE